MNQKQKLKKRLKRKGKEVYRASNKIKKNTDERCY